MREHLASGGWRVPVAVALVVAGAWLAVALVPHGIGGVGDDPVVTNPGPPPSVDAFRENPRKRYMNRVTNRVFTFAPGAVPVVGAFAGFVGARGRRSRRGGGGRDRRTGGRRGEAAAGRRVSDDVAGQVGSGVSERDVNGDSGSAVVAAGVAVGAFVGGVLGYALFVAVATQAYAAVPGGYVLESYPPTVSAGGVATNAVGTGLPTAVGAFLAALVAERAAVGRRCEDDAAER